MLSSGALAIHLGLFPSPSQYVPLRGAERGRRDGSRVGTLLGPEGTGFSPGLQLQAAGRHPCRGGGLWCCPFLENCTVDASIYIPGAPLFPSGRGVPLRIL